MTDDQNLALYVATYLDSTVARKDFETLKAAEAGDLAIEGAVAMARGPDGRVDLLESGNGDSTEGRWTGGDADLVVGLFAPPLLLSTATGAGILGLVGQLTRKHEDGELGADLDEYFPPGSSAIVVLAEHDDLGRVGAALTNAAKNTTQDVDAGDYAKLKEALPPSTSAES